MRSTHTSLLRRNLSSALSDGHTFISKLVLDLTDTTVEQESSILVTPHVDLNVIEDDLNVFVIRLACSLIARNAIHGTKS